MNATTVTHAMTVLSVTIMKAVSNASATRDTKAMAYTVKMSMNASILTRMIVIKIQIVQINQVVTVAHVDEVTEATTPVEMPKVVTVKI